MQPSTVFTLALFATSALAIPTPPQQPELQAPVVPHPGPFRDLSSPETPLLECRVANKPAMCRFNELAKSYLCNSVDSVCPESWMPILDRHILLDMKSACSNSAAEGAECQQPVKCCPPESVKETYKPKGNLRGSSQDDIWSKVPMPLFIATGMSLVLSQWGCGG